MFEIKNYFEAYEPKAQSFSARKSNVSENRTSRASSPVKEESSIYCPDGEFETLSTLAETTVSLAFNKPSKEVVADLDHKLALRSEVFQGKALAISRGWFRGIVLNHLKEATTMGFQWEFHEVKAMLYGYYSMAINEAKKSKGLEKVSFFKLANLIDPEGKSGAKLIRRMTSKFNKAMRIADTKEVKATELEDLFLELVIELKEKEEINVE